MSLDLEEEIKNIIKNTEIEDNFEEKDLILDHRYGEITILESK